MSCVCVCVCVCACRVATAMQHFGVWLYACVMHVLRDSRAHLCDGCGCFLQINLWCLWMSLKDKARLVCHLPKPTTHFHLCRNVCVPWSTRAFLWWVCVWWVCVWWVCVWWVCVWWVCVSLLETPRLVCHLAKAIKLYSTHYLMCRATR